MRTIPADTQKEILGVIHEELHKLIYYLVSAWSEEDLSFSGIDLQLQVQNPHNDYWPKLLLV